MKNVLMICIDDLRKDVCSFGKFLSMPNLHAFQSECVCFRNAFTTSSWSPQVAYSVLTGADPVFTPFSVSTEEEQTHRRFGFSSQSKVAKDYFSLGLSANCWVMESFGFDTLFDRWYYNRRTPYSQAADLLKSGLPEPWFFYLHLMDIHDRKTNEEFPQQERTPTNFKRYRQSALDLDSKLAQLLSMDVLKDATVCIYSDHGECFLDVDKKEGLKKWGHGHCLSPVLLGVPLFIKSPSPREEKSVVSLRHLMKILLELNETGEYSIPDSVVSAFVAHEGFARMVKFDGASFDGTYDEHDLLKMTKRSFEIGLE